MENTKEINGFKIIMDEIFELKRKKAMDYGQTWRAFGLAGIYPLIGKKFGRIWLNKDKSETDLNFESMRDSLIDMVVYCVMCIQLMDERDTEDKIKKILENI